MSFVAERWRSLDNPALFLSIAESTLETCLEPIVDTRTGKLVACEALMRGVQDMGFENPHVLLNHAERIGALKDLEIKLACQAISDMAAMGTPRPRLFLNIDGRTLPDWREYSEVLLFHVESAGLSPAEICLEISEAQQVLVGDALRVAIDGLRAAGFRIAIDDFGTGVSGLHMLYHARPNFLKIDRFFVQAMPTDPHKRLLVHAVTELAHTLGARVIAEGVETEEELQACRQADCGLIQGFLLKGPQEDHATLKKDYNLPGKTDPGASMDMRLKEIIQRPDPVGPDVPLSVVYDRFYGQGGSDVLPIVDETGLLLGVTLWAKLREVFGSKFGAALAQNPSFAFDVMDTAVELPVIDVRQPLINAIDLVAEDAQNGVMVVDRDNYVGYLSAYDLMKLANAMLLTEAKRRNPLTGLPGNEAINDLVREFAARPNAQQCVCYIDISDFKSFNNCFGFELGDRAILMLTDLLKRLADITGAFVGHTGGDDFVVLYEGEDLDGLTDLLSQVPAEFAESALGLVPEHLRDGQYYMSKTRTGEDRKTPVLGATIVECVFEKDQQVPNTTEAAAYLMRLKSQSREEKRRFYKETFAPSV